MLKAGVPDNVIGPRDAPWLIVDAKYKNPLRESWGKEYFHNEDLYQAFTYAAALDAPAVLVYPRVDRDVDVAVGSTTCAVHINTIDLTGGDSFKLRLPQVATPAQRPVL